MLPLVLFNKKKNCLVDCIKIRWNGHPTLLLAFYPTVIFTPIKLKIASPLDRLFAAFFWGRRVQMAKDGPTKITTGHTR